MPNVEGSQGAVENILGLDLGVNSIGWCLTESDDKGEPRNIINCGCRIFDAGMEGDISSGKGESRGVARRQARQQRRMTERRARRLRKLLHVLQRMELLPQGDAKDILPELDKELIKTALADPTLTPPEKHRLAQVFPYWLRAQALNRKLDKYELGRAFYHLGQRRGYLSNRNSPQKDDEDKGKVETGIAEIRKAMGSRTLGEYFSQVDPDTRRIRQNWTARQMFKDEFKRIWDTQQKHWPEVLTEEQGARIWKAIFHQRPLKSANHLIGRCSLENGKRRAPWAILPAQRFRMLQQVNHCNVITSDGEIRPFTPEERSKLLETLQSEGDLAFGKAKTLLGMKRTFHFTLEEGGESRFMGNRTNAELREIFGQEWDAFSESKKESIVDDVRGFQSVEALAAKAQRDWNLSPEHAEKLAKLELQPAYCNLSRKAIEKLLPHLEKGLPYSQAVVAVYGDFDVKQDTKDILPPVDKLSDLRNPVVSRVLTELRKVVNGVVKEYGKPARIRIELARDLKKNKKQRQEATTKIRSNESARKKAAQKITKDIGIPNPKRDDILKVLLADECDWTCPYSGKTITMPALFGPEPQFDIEHIIPFSRCLDDSFLNKTLCYHEENRNTKRNQTPHEAYAGNPEKWDNILGAVRRFRGDAAKEKLRRFMLEEIDSVDDFASSQLNDTRYASKLAMEYLACLYGGLWDESGTRRIEACKGGTTAYMREVLGMNRILGDGGTKNREDHRHHAVDALAIALTTPGFIKKLSELAVWGAERRTHKGRFRTPDEPWENFYNDAKSAIDGIIVSHRVSHKVNGPLHEETNYGRIQLDGKKTFCVRKPLAFLKPGDIENIVDDKIRELVKAKLDELKQPPDTAFADPKNHPVIPPKHGLRETPIHRVRIKVSSNPKPIGNDHRQRFCTTKENHHMEVVAILDKNGNETKWEGVIVDTMEAMKRLAAKQPIVQRDHGPNKCFKFSLAVGDTLKLTNRDKEPELVVVHSISSCQDGGSRLEFADIRDSRKTADIKKAKGWFGPRTNTLMKLGAQKVSVSPTGKVSLAND